MLKVFFNIFDNSFFKVSFRLNTNVKMLKKNAGVPEYSTSFSSTKKYPF